MPLLSIGLAAGLFLPVTLPRYGEPILLCRANPFVGASYNLPFGSAILSSRVAIDPAGNAAVRVSFAITEGYFVGSAGGPNGLVYSRTGSGGQDDLDVLGTTALVQRNETGTGAFTVAGGAVQRDFPGGGTFNVRGLEGARFIGGRTDSIAYLTSDFSGFRRLITDRWDGTTRTQTQIFRVGAEDVGELLDPAVNDSAVFTGWVTNRSFWREIRRFREGQPSVILATAGCPTCEYSEFWRSPAIANDGEVVFGARRVSTGASEIVHSDGPNLVTIARMGERGLTSFSSLAINSRHWVVFRGVDATSDALYIAEGNQLRRVVGDGTVVQTDLGTRTLGYFESGFGRRTAIGPASINDSGAIAFIGLIDNNQSSPHRGLFLLLPFCPSDMNTDGGVTIDDLLAYLEAYADGTSGADFNDDQGVTIDDLLGYLESYANGC